MSCNKEREVKYTVYSDKCLSQIEILKNKFGKHIVTVLAAAIHWDVAHDVEGAHEVPECANAWLMEIYSETDPVYHVRYVFVESTAKRLIIAVKIDAV